MVYLGRKFERFMYALEGRNSVGRPVIESEMRDAVLDAVSFRRKSGEIMDLAYKMFLDDAWDDNESQLIAVDIFIEPLLVSDQYDPNSLSALFRRGNHLGPV